MKEKIKQIKGKAVNKLKNMSQTAKGIAIGIGASIIVLGSVGSAYAAFSDTDTKTTETTTSTESTTETTIQETSIIQESSSESSTELATQSSSNVSNQATQPTTQVTVQETTIANAPNAKYFTYQLTGNGNAQITGYNGTETNLVIPNYIDGHQVISILSLSENKSIQSVDVPNGATIIENYAFRNCKNLASINLPNTLTTIQEGIVLGCDNLQSIVVPSNVTSIAENSFWHYAPSNKPPTPENPNKELVYDYGSIVLYVSNGSNAMQFAIDHNIPYSAQ